MVKSSDINNLAAASVLDRENNIVTVRSYERLTPLARLLPAWHSALGGACLTGPDLIEAASFDGPESLVLREGLLPFGGDRASALGRMLARFAGQRAAGFRLEMFRQRGEGNRVVFQVLPDGDENTPALFSGETAAPGDRRDSGVSRAELGSEVRKQSQGVNSRNSLSESVQVAAGHNLQNGYYRTLARLHEE